jgi:hypothetical protein
MSRHTLFNDINRLLVYKANRSISRGERARQHQREIEATSRQMTRDMEKFKVWAEDGNMEHPLTLQISAAIEQIHGDLRLTNETRMQKMAVVMANAVRLMPPPVKGSKLEKYNNRMHLQSVLKGTMWAVGVIMIMSYCHSSQKPTVTAPVVETASPTATPTPSVELASVEELSAPIIPTPAPILEMTPMPTPVSVKRTHRHHK